MVITPVAEASGLMCAERGAVGRVGGSIAFF